MVLRSSRFDDIYFSVEDGLAETRHVFLQGNHLPGAWRDKAEFTIAETGFGTGLNFLAAWQLFEETARPDQQLHFISVEQYPLKSEEILLALQPWRPEIGGRLNTLAAQYPRRVPGFHRLPVSPRVSLTLIFDDVNVALPSIVAPRGVDCWFLDGFTPAKNPGMWTPAVFGEMARLSHAETTIATFTVAASVRDGLQKVGFHVEKAKGFGRKRDMLTGRFSAGAPRGVPPPRRRVAIIGGGLAGAAAAYQLRLRGHMPVLFEAAPQLASGASGNPEAMVNLRLQAQRTAVSDFYTAAFTHASRHFAELQSTGDVGFRACGSLFLLNDAERARKATGALAHWGWPPDELWSVDATDAASIAGVPLSIQALYLPAAGTITPALLCRRWALDVPGRLSTNVTAPHFEDGSWHVRGQEFDAVVLAAGEGLLDLALTANLPLRRVRGQLTAIATTPWLSRLQTNLCYDGYLSPAVRGTHQVGATYQRDPREPQPRPEDNADNLRRMAAILPGRPEPEVRGERVGFRVAAGDHFPVIGEMPGAPPGLYISGAHGSYGVISSLAGAILLGDMLAQTPHSLSAASIRALSPARFAVKTA